MTVKQFFDTTLLTKELQDIFLKAKPVMEISGHKVTTGQYMTYGQMMELRAELAKEVTDLQAVAVVIRVLVSEQIDPLACDLYEVMPYVLSILRFVENSVKKEKKKLKYTPTPDEKRAGIDRLNQFGQWGTIDTIARRCGIMHDEVLNLRYNDVFLMLWKDLEEVKFQQRLSRIMTT